MDILDMAREAGFAVLLDGRIGQEEYSTVSGSKEALQSFANAVRIAAEREHLRRARFGQAARERRRAAARKAAISRRTRRSMWRSENRRGHAGTVGRAPGGRVFLARGRTPAGIQPI